MIKSKIILFVIFFISSIFYFKSSYALIYNYSYAHGWELGNEDKQFAVINYENGYQKMILCFNAAEMKGEKAVWIFSVPSRPDKIIIDKFKGFPNFIGYDVKNKKENNILEAFSIMRLSQVYTFPMALLLYYYFDYWDNFLDGYFLYFGFIDGHFYEKELSTYKNSGGISIKTELIGTKHSEALYNYFANREFEPNFESKRIIDEYIGKDYSFVVSWISDVEKLKEECRIDYGTLITSPCAACISITFQTDKIYYPLKTVSVYGDKEVMISMDVIGHVTPELSQELRNKIEVNYFIKENYYVPEDLSYFFNEKTKIKDFKYTRIKIRENSENLNEDLWLKDSTPINVVLDDFINRFVLVLSIVIFILSSCLASLFSGMIVFREEKISKKKLALFGLWNFLTLIGFIIATIFLKTKELEPKLENQLKSQRIIIWDKRKILFILLFSIFFLFITFAFQILLQFI